MGDGILLAHDLTARCRPVVAAAGRLAAQLDLPLSALHVLSNQDLEARREGRPVDSAFVDVVVKELEAQLRTDVEAETAGLGVSNAGVQVLMDDPHTAIVAYLEQHDFEYVFLGVRNRSRVGKLLFGSVAQSVLLSTPTKVVVVPIGE